MENGSKIFYTLEDLGKKVDRIYANHKRIGAWFVGTKIHDGHRLLYNKAKNKCDYVIGVYCNTWSEQLYEIYGRKQDVAVGINNKTLNELVEKTDLVMVYANGYTSFIDPKGLRKRSEKELPDNELPGFIKNDAQNIASLRTAQSFHIKFNEYVKYDYLGGGQKDPWRLYYKNWHDKYYPYIEYELVTSVLDEYGNCLASSVPENIKKQINKPLLVPGMRSIEEVIENVKDIDGLRVVFFNYNPENNFLNARFQCGDDENMWWNQGLSE